MLMESNQKSIEYVRYIKLPVFCTLDNATSALQQSHEDMLYLITRTSTKKTQNMSKSMHM